MKITRMFVTRYKNLVDCEIKPSELHVLTGCNGSGKTNFLESLHFVSALMLGDESSRLRLLSGTSTAGSPWVPEYVPEEPFRFELSVSIPYEETVWDLDYSLSIVDSEKKKGVESLGRIISQETIFLKEKGKTGAKRKLLNRSKNIVSVSFESNSRKKEVFNVKPSMLGLATLELRMAEDFGDAFPVVSLFYKSIFSSGMLKLDPEWIVSDTLRDARKKMELEPGEFVTHFSIYSLIEHIKEDEQKFKEYKNWLKILCNIDDVRLYDEKGIPQPIVFLHIKDRIWYPFQLSTGTAMLLGIVTALFSFLDNQGVVLIEEPETYLHPAAIIDLVKLLREASETRPILISTHSPVLLNAFKPEEVSVMQVSDDGSSTAVAVSDIDEATKALKRGYVSFGDLLQSNFQNS